MSIVFPLLYVWVWDELKLLITKSEEPSPQMNLYCAFVDKVEDELKNIKSDCCTPEHVVVFPVKFASGFCLMLTTLVFWLVHPLLSVTVSFTEKSSVPFP